MFKIVEACVALSLSAFSVAAGVLLALRIFNVV